MSTLESFVRITPGQEGQNGKYRNEFFCLPNSIRKINNGGNFWIIEWAIDEWVIHKCWNQKTAIDWLMENRPGVSVHESTYGNYMIGMLRIPVRNSRE